MHTETKAAPQQKAKVNDIMMLRPFNQFKSLKTTMSKAEIEHIEPIKFNTSRFTISLNLLGCGLH